MVDGIAGLAESVDRFAEANEVSCRLMEKFRGEMTTMVY